MNDNNATLGTGTTGTASENMRGHLAAPTTEAKTVGSQVEVGSILETDSRVLQGSHGVSDHRQQAASVSPLVGNDRPVRSQTGTVGS